MVRLYSNENFDRSVVEQLRNLGYDVLTTFEAGKANQGIPDEEVLAFAIAENRAIITFNRLDFIHLHRQNPTHPGIIVCTRNPNAAALTLNINAAIQDLNEHLENSLIRVYCDQ